MISTWAETWYKYGRIPTSCIRREKAITHWSGLSACGYRACRAAPGDAGGVSGSFLLLSEGKFMVQASRSFLRMGRLWSWRVQVPFLKPSHLDNERRAESFLCRAAVKNKKSLWEWKDDYGEKFSERFHLLNVYWKKRKKTPQCGLVFLVHVGWLVVRLS